MIRYFLAAGVPIIMSGFAFGEEPSTTPRDVEKRYYDVEERLAAIAAPLPKPGPGDWLAQHKERGQTFEQYLRARAIRKSETHDHIFLCLVGDFSKEQQQVLATTAEYLELFYQSPVKVYKVVRLDAIPADAKRVHPTSGNEQILSTYVLNEVLKPHRPDNALAYIAFTSSDLWPGEGWNFVFGQASLTDRVGVWSIFRNGDPGASKKDFQLCLRRTMTTATHETGHIFGMPHCIAFHCNMNGSNNQEESDRAPAHFCPTCLRKLCWNLQASPAGYLEGLESFCEKHGLVEEAEWYARARARLEAIKPK